MTDSRTISIGTEGNAIAVETIGHGDESVLFVHGLGSNRGCWYRARELFDLERYRLIMLDFPGFGESSRPTNFDYSMASLGDCLGQVIGELALRRPHVVAHSMGCSAALSMLERHPLELATFLTAEGNLVAEDAFMSSRIARFTEADFLRAYPIWLSVMRQFWGGEPNLQHDRFIASLREAFPIAMYRASVSCNERTRAGTLASQFAAMACPVAYVYGANTPAKRPIPAVVQSAHVQRSAILGQGHFMMEAAERFYPLVQAFISTGTLPNQDGCH
jgi:pimeloyl-ACP methyl ester carboxylesterase